MATIYYINSHYYTIGRKLQSGLAAETPTSPCISPSHDYNFKAIQTYTILYTNGKYLIDMLYILLSSFLFFQT